MKERFISRRFSGNSQKLIIQANGIIEEYTAQGFTLTLRQLYYQMVARDIIPNQVQSYKRLGSILNDARYAGLVDWDALEDRTRNLQGTGHWEAPGDVIASAAYSYRIDKWQDQRVRPEIWVEKEALAGVVQRAALKNDVSFLSCRGYMSASEMYAAAQRAARRVGAGQRTLIIYLGDHDPSGIDMSECDIPKRFEIFLDKYGYDPVDVNRVALNWDQIKLYSPPPNPAKETDSRFVQYQQKFGDESWELDALEPSVLLGLIQQAIDNVKNPAIYAYAEKREVTDRKLLHKASEHWDEVAEFLDGLN